METTAMPGLICRMSQELGDQLLREAEKFGPAWGRLCDAEVAEWLRQLGLQTVQYMIETTVVEAVVQHQAAGLSLKRAPIIRSNTIFGPVRLDSPYLWHAEYGSAKPLHELGVTRDGRSEAVERALSDCGSECSFERAADRFAEHYHYPLSPSTADRVTKQAGQAAQDYLGQRLQAATDDIEAAETVLVEADGCLIRTGTFRMEAASPSRISIGEAALAAESTGPTMPTLLPGDPVRDVPRQKDIEWTEVRMGLARLLDEERPAEKLFVGKVASYPDLMTDLTDAAGLVGLTDTSRVVAVADGANG